MTDIPVPPGADPASAFRPSAHDSITPAMLDALAKTKPWVRFLAILGFVMVGVILIAAVVVFGMGITMGMKSGAEGFMLAALSLFYVAMAVLYIFPSRYLYRYASAIEQALQSPSKSHAFEQALQHQKSFWKFAGIMALIMLLLYIPGIILAIALPNLLTAMGR